MIFKGIKKGTWSWEKKATNNETYSNIPQDYHFYHFGINPQKQVREELKPFS